VAALVRRYSGEAIPAVVEQRGAEEAGAVFVVIDLLNGSGDLYGPAPQSSFEGKPSDRLFQRMERGAALPEIAKRLERERRFDPDIWVVTIEDRGARLFFDTVPEEAKG
jgi:hypothetical protein